MLVSSLCFRAFVCVWFVFITSRHLNRLRLMCVHVCRAYACQCAICPYSFTECCLQGVGALNALIPLPSTHMLFFKRMLVRMQERDPSSQLWYGLFSKWNMHKKINVNSFIGSPGDSLHFSTS